MKKFIKTPLANRLLAQQMEGLAVREMEREHLGRTGQSRV